jgi:hypothetical protein
MSCPALIALALRGSGKPKEYDQRSVQLPKLVVTETPEPLT